MQPVYSTRQDSSAAANGSEERVEFSLVAGGPLYRLALRAGLLKKPYGGVRRLVTALVLLTWLPLAVLVLLVDTPPKSAVPFWQDFEVHLRLLLSLPMFLLAEPFVHRCLQKTVSEFLGHGILRGGDRQKFRHIVQEHMRSLDSNIFEGVLFILACTLGVWVRWYNMAPTSNSWVFVREGSAIRFTPAGYWYSAVSIPVLQFLQVRWYLRLIQWYRLLWKVSRLDLRVIPNHPDQAGGLGFIGDGAVGFAPVLFAHGIGISGMLADHIVFDGASLLSYRFEIIGSLVVLLATFLGPMLIFTPRLLAAKWGAVHEYGAFVSRFLDAFNSKWVRGEASQNTEDFLSTADIQNQANISSSFEAVNAMRAVPFERSLVILYAASTIIPLLPLALTMYSPAELVERLATALF